MTQWPTLKKRTQTVNGSPIHSDDNSADSASSANSNENELTIGHSLRFRGDLEVAANLKIEGTVKGCIHAGPFDVVIETDGLADANVHAGSVTVRGKVKGAIIASGTVRLEKGSSVDGPIHAARVVLEDGCHLSGRIDVSTDNSIPATTPQSLIATQAIDMSQVRQVNEDLRSAHD
jgi:cytoskeletal protein CcmA (bactofilin family)